MSGLTKDRIRRYWELVRDAFGQSRKTHGTQRISSLAPHSAATALAVMGAAWLVVTGYQATSLTKIPLAPFGLAIGHLLASVAVLAVWKQVRRGEGHYFVTNFLKSETVGLEDVCVVVTSPGVYWTTARIHFRRKTRFGWAISYVPAKRAEQGTAVSAHPRRRLL